MRYGWLMLALCACKPNLRGWWDLASWEVDGAPYKSAGFLVWEETDGLGGGYFALLLRYRWDSEQGELVPDPEPVVSTWGWDFEEWKEDMPIVPPLVDENEIGVGLTMELVEYSTSRMRLEGESPYGDGALWTWKLRK
jgi:hypothetical protein